MCYLGRRYDAFLDLRTTRQRRGVKATVDEPMWTASNTSCTTSRMRVIPPHDCFEGCLPVFSQEDPKEGAV